MKPLFEHGVIVGCGLLGTSLGMALRARGLVGSGGVTGIGKPGSRSPEVGKQRGGFDRVSTDLHAAAQTETPADLVVFCTPLRQFAPGFRAVAGWLKPGTIVTDVGSVKAQVMTWAAQTIPPEPQAFFVGSHPMAGSEKSGPEAARADLFEGAVCLICPGEKVATSRVRAMWEAIGMRVIELNPAMHDRWVAMISHLPHALAFALMNVAARDEKMLEAVAGGFMDMTRVAGSDVAMWTDIFLTNREALAGAIGVFEGELGRLKQMVQAGDETGIRGMIENARTARERLLAQRKSAGLTPGALPRKEL